MYADIIKPPLALPEIKLQDVSFGLRLLSPLTRRGHGPGIITIVTDGDDSLRVDHGVPGTLMKWAEEGYTVAEIVLKALFTHDNILGDAVNALKACHECDWEDKVGIVGELLPRELIPQHLLKRLSVYDEDCWARLAPLVEQVPEIAATVAYISTDSDFTTPGLPSNIPTLFHVSGPSHPTPPSRSENLMQYFYPSTHSSKFATPSHGDFHYRSEALSHTRSLTFLKPNIGGPYFDLECIWDEHTYYEFSDRSVEHTMSTMVQEPYVNHVPTLTGGIGRERLSKFYRDSFIFNNSADTEMELISRTIGIDRVVDEFIFKFTHDKELDWLLPGVPPTNLKVEVPFTAVVNIRGDRLYHEHIAWDQCTVLRQLGLMPEYLPFPHALPEGYPVSPDAKVEYRVPTTGLDQATKLREKNSVASNEMFDFKVRARQQM